MKRPELPKLTIPTTPRKIKNLSIDLLSEVRNY